jgi:uncharacterized sulfatase
METLSTSVSMSNLQQRSFFVWVWLLLAPIMVHAADESRPNILFILTDDQAPYAVRAAGDERFITPNIDRIFHEGAHLTNAFVVSPVCSPSRAELMTSRYGSELGILDWINPKAEPELGLPADISTWPQFLQKAGYRTALVGKWHLGTLDEQHPTKFGYEYFMGIRTGGCPPKDPILELPDGRSEKVEGYTCDILTDHALSYIDEHQDESFAVSLHFRAPHAAWLPVRPEDWAPFENLDPEIPNPDFPNLDVPLIKKRTREYLAAVKSIDRNVGRLLEQLENLKLADNTIVIFTSDHGYNLGEHGVWYKGNAIRALTENPPQQWDKIPAKRRPNLWDTSLRVPAAVRWPGVIEAGTEIDEVVDNMDWFPTLLGMAGVEVPQDLNLRGRDLGPVLRSENSGWTNDLYSEYSMRHGATTDMRGWRTPKWKYMIDFANPGREELYDLSKDPDETTNLVKSNDPEHVRTRSELGEKIRARMKEIGDFALSEDR